MKTKEYIYKVTDMIAKKDRLDIDVFPYYFLGYYKSDLFKYKFRIHKIYSKNLLILTYFP